MRSATIKESGSYAKKACGLTAPHTALDMFEAIGKPKREDMPDLTPIPGLWMFSRSGAALCSPVRPRMARASDLLPDVRAADGCRPHAKTTWSWPTAHLWLCQVAVITAPRG